MSLPEEKPSRIMIFGPPGAGKSTFAYQLHQQANIPLYHLDKYFYVANWVERDYQEFLKIQQQLVDQESWIIDGNCTKSFEMRYARATVAIYFHLPKWVCLWRVLKRRFYKNPLLDDRAENCPEIVRWKLIKYLWAFDKRVKENLKHLRQTYPDVQFIEAKSRGEVEGIYRQLTSNPS